MTTTTFDKLKVGHIFSYEGVIFVKIDPSNGFNFHPSIQNWDDRFCKEYSGVALCIYNKYWDKDNNEYIDPGELSFFESYHEVIPVSVEFYNQDDVFIGEIIR